MSKPFLLLQIREHNEAAKNEYLAFRNFGGLSDSNLHRIQLDRQRIPVDFDVNNFTAIIIGGGPYNVADKNKSTAQVLAEQDIEQVLSQVTKQDFPYFGACYGMHVLSKYLKVPVNRDSGAEPVGTVQVQRTEDSIHDPLTSELPFNFNVFTGHKEATQQLPDDCALLATNDTCPFQMYRYKTNIYAVQFHPELDSDGLAIRINIYKNEGYFPPEETERLIQKAHQTNIEQPVNIWRNFVERYI